MIRCSFDAWRRLVARGVRLALLIVLWLSACTSTPTPEPEPSLPAPATVTFACYDFERTYYQELVSVFQGQTPGVRVRLVSLGQLDAAGAVPLEELAGTADTFVASSLFLGFVPSRAGLLDLTEIAEEDEAFDPADFYPVGLRALQREDRLWGLPLTLNLRLIFYDRAAFRRANLPMPAVGWSWDDFVNAALVFTDREGDRVVRYGYEDAMPAYSLPMLAYQKAGPLVNTQAVTRTTVARRPVALALQWYADLALDHEVMVRPDLDIEAAGGKARVRAPAMWAASSFEYDTFRAKYDDLGVVPFPESGDPANGVVVRGAFVSAAAAHPPEAWQWILFLTRQQPSTYHDSIPARVSVSRASDLWRELDDEAAAAYQYGLAHSVHFPGPIYTALNRAYRLILAGDPAAQALAVAQTELEQGMVSPGGSTPAPP